MTAHCLFNNDKRSTIFVLQEKKAGSLVASHTNNFQRFTYLTDDELNAIYALVTYDDWDYELWHPKVQSLFLSLLFRAAEENRDMKILNEVFRSLVYSNPAKVVNVATNQNVLELCEAVLEREIANGFKNSAEAELKQIYYEILKMKKTKEGGDKS